LFCSSLTPCSAFLFCYVTADPRHLPSFPTRRSSDLIGPVGSDWRRRAAARTVAARATPPGAPSPGWAATRGRTGAATAVEPWTRSEEHTSELQSRENLVCRLLLEKKKQAGRARTE